MKLKTLASLSILGSLLGCSTIVPGAPGGSTVSVVKDGVPSRVHAAPRLSATHTMADKLYALARQAHAGGQLGAAAQGYERVLSLQPGHAGALNALGVIRAQDGRTSEALDLFVQARDQAPSEAHIHNNLGYALLKADRLDEAQVALRMARDLDPGSLRMLENMALLAQAQREKDSHTEAGPVDEASDNSMDPRLLAVAPNIFELRPMGPQAIEAGVGASAVASPEVASIALADHQEPGYKLALSRSLGVQGQPFPTWNDAHDVRLEVSNGVGVPRLARRTADRLADTGVDTARLTNARHFKHERTQVQYLAGQEDALKALMARLPVEVTAVRVDRLDAQVQMRLVLGRDVAGRTIAAWSQSGGASLADAAPALGGARVG